MIAVTRLKRCAKCQQAKEPVEFHKHGPSRDGLHPRCKECRSEDKRQGRRYKTAKRTCLRCRKRKSPKDFHVHSKREDGLTQLCKACLRECLTQGKEVENAA